MRNCFYLALAVLVAGAVGCEPPRGSRSPRAQAGSKPPDAPDVSAPSLANESLAADPNLRAKIIGLWTNSTGPPGTGTSYSFLNSGEYQSKANLAGSSTPSVVDGKWEMAGDTIIVKVTAADGSGQTIHYKVHKVETDGLILVKDQKEPMILFRR